MMKASEIIKWLAAFPEDTEIAIDTGDHIGTDSLVEISHGEFGVASLQVGGLLVCEYCDTQDCRCETCNHTYTAHNGGELQNTLACGWCECVKYACPNVDETHVP